MLPNSDLQNPSKNNQSLICAFDPARLLENRYRKADKRSAFPTIWQTAGTFFSKSCNYVPKIPQKSPILRKCTLLVA
eukprot:g75075.t1